MSVLASWLLLLGLLVLIGALVADRIEQLQSRDGDRRADT